MKVQSAGGTVYYRSEAMFKLYATQQIELYEASVHSLPFHHLRWQLQSLKQIAATPWKCSYFRKLARGL